MRNRPLPYVVALALLGAALLPLAGDAGLAAPPQSKAACCTTFEPPPPPPPDGDREFMEIKQGVANVMLLLDTSGSMVEFPRELAWRGYSLSGSSAQTVGTCGLATPFVNDTTAYDLADSKYDVPYDNGQPPGEMTDDPPWGKARCEAKQPRPTIDGARDWCMFRADSFYKWVDGANRTTFWGDTDPRTYNANPCAAVAADGDLIYDRNGNLVTADVAACTACLATKGYYFFRSRYRSGSSSYSNTPEQIVFSGRFMNAFPLKHVIARKVVKDLVRLDPEKGTDSVRFGLTIFVSGTGNSGTYSSFRTGDGGRLVVPLGPDCTSSSSPEAAPNRAQYVIARQAIVDAINAVDTGSSSWPARHLDFASNTPLSETLFNVGQYFSNAGTTSLYNSLFGAGWVLPRTGDARDFRETATGLVNASWAQAGKNQRSFCWACQQSSVVVVTDGEPNADSNLPLSSTSSAHSTFNKDFRYWTNPVVDCPACQCDLSYGDTCTLTSPITPTSGRIPNSLHKVAYFLAQTDLRPDLANPTSQNVATYTISFGLDDSATAPAGHRKAIALLRKTAELGGGLFANTSSGEQLRDALNTAVSDVVSRSTSFSSSNANSLQTSKTNQVDAYLGRFRPFEGSTMWEGHLFAAMVFDEFAQGCDERFSTANQKTLACGTSAAQNPNLNGDEKDGKAVCGSAFMVDKDCDPIIADSQGNYKKGTFDSDGTLVAAPGDANMAWDAGKVLSCPFVDGNGDCAETGSATPGYRSAKEGVANSRSITTVVDLNGDGKLTPADGLVDFTADNAAALAPSMDLERSWCLELLRKTGNCGDTTFPACPAWSTATKELCAKQVIHFIRGWDVLDWDNDHCAGPGSYDNTNGWGSCTTNAACGTQAVCSGGRCFNTNCTADGEQRDRTRDSRPAAEDRQFWKLGDIFHSSPVLVKPPVDKATCVFGRFENQCVATLYGGSGFSAQSGSCYPPLEKYGAVDAYDKYRADHLDRPMVVVVGANDGMLHAFDAGTAETSKPKRSNGNYQYTPGTGAELWAFIPPDLLPRLRRALDAHTYFVDGNTMVRDVWVDLDEDGAKQADEYRTVAVLSERGGGTRFTALDITDPTAPQFLWTFPEGCSELSPQAGQSWSDFLPRAPPIGPVRIEVTTDDPGKCGFEERWVVALNGGYDPAMVRGRYVALADVWTGKVLWKFDDADFKAMRGDTQASMLPVAATVGMVDIGKAEAVKGFFDSDGYFDTATWGDVGGNLFVARMHAVGDLDASSGLVQNWFAARTFEMNRKTDDSQAARGKSQFFLMTANFIDYPSRLYTLLGSGNRERLLQQTPKCGPSNLLGCCQAQCGVVSATSSVDYGGGSCRTGGTFTCNGGNLQFTPAATSGCSGSYACGPAHQRVTVDVSCAGVSDPAPWSAAFDVDPSGVATHEVAMPAFPAEPDFDVAALMPACGPNAPRDCYFGVWSYGVAAEKRFTTLEEAKAFEGNRFTDVPGYAGCGSIGTCSVVDVTLTEARSTGTVGAEAKVGDPGWKYCYGRKCPVEGCAETWCDERTTSQPLGVASCIEWASFRPTGSGGSTNPCETSIGMPTAFSYRANFLSGVPDASCNRYEETVGSDVVYGRATRRDTLAPPNSPSVHASVDEHGGTQTASLNTGDQGTDKKVFGKTHSIAQPLYQIEVPRVVHTCRHVDPSTCE
jgi:type IV pilus assembly protein PilY1